MVTTLLANARGVQKYLLHCSTHEATEVIAVCSCDTETVVRN